MSVSHVPRGFTSVTPYFIVDDGGKWIKFLKDAFDAEVVDEHYEDGTLRHGAFRIFGSMIEGSEGGGEYPDRTMSIHLYVEDCDAVYARAISAGGSSIFEVTDMPYGERSGGVIDPCGNHWYIATQKVDMYPDNDQ